MTKNLKKETLRKKEEKRIEFIRKNSTFDLKDDKAAKRLWNTFVFYNNKSKQDEITDFVLRLTALLKYEILEQDVVLKKEDIWALAQKCDFEENFNWSDNIENDKALYEVLSVIFKCWKYGADLEYVLTEYF